MSVTAESWAWEQVCPSSAAKSVLVCLGWYANKEGQDAFPSIATIRRRTQHAERTIRKALAELVQAKLIEPCERKTGAGRCLSTEYRLKIGELDCLKNGEATLADLPPLADLPGVQICQGDPSKFARESKKGKEEEKESPTDSPKGDGGERFPWEDEDDPPVQSTPPQPTQSKPKPPAEPPGFAEWYALYPRKKKRGDAVKAYARALRRVSAEILLASLKAQLPALARSGPAARDGADYRPYPASWLNAECWADDQPEPERPKPKPRFSYAPDRFFCDENGNYGVPR